MIDGEYIIEGDLSSKEKREAWDAAIGLQAVDGLEVSQYLREKSEEHINDKLTIGEVEKLVKSYYERKEERIEIDGNTEEADKVAVNIAKVLGEKAFSFSVPGFLSTHKRIFDGVFPFAGQLRKYNITKKEWVLDGDTVRYTPFEPLGITLEYDLSIERNFDYSSLKEPSEIVSHLTRFVAGLWQIHPFGEGNTRTTAIFTIQYLRTLGFKVDNDLFKENSWYFRNALVRANFQNLDKGVTREYVHLERFFENLLYGANHPLSNRLLHIRCNSNVKSINLSELKKSKGLKL